VTERAISAIRAGEAVVIPADTVYGLVASPFRSEPVERLYEIKGRGARQPTALMAPDVDTLFELVPELRGRARVLATALLPGLLTLVLPNPARRFRWLTGERPDTIGVRVPELPVVSAPILAAVGALAATSANLSGGRDPVAVDEVPVEIRESCAAVIDGGRLPGTPSTVVDLTGPEPRVLREGAVSADEVLERASAVTRS
jgi:tRNA threonylcarbamoyl adenosine modification protein (Sua5/YciO/YrdC/YwlC family)